MESPHLLFVFACLFVGVMSTAQPLDKPDDISDEMYCMGCEITMKELHLILNRKPTRGMGETVTRALSRVCDVSTFKKYEYNAEKVYKVCKHIIQDEVLEEVLVADYGRKHATGQDTSYLQISKKVCGAHLQACHTTVLRGTNEEDGGIKYNPDTEEFTILDGKKVRRVNPVPAMKSTEPEVEEFDSLPVGDQDVEEIDSLPSNAANMHKDSHEEL